MTDSESDTSNNVFNFQNENTTVSAKGPNTNITNLSFRNHLTSTMYMPRNIERQRYAESAYDQRSMYYRRETSPMSIHSACDIRPRNFQQYYPGSSQKSVFNGRSGSPMSMRSIDSTASVSAAEIAFAFKNGKYNKYDLKVIKEAYHKLMKQRVRKRIEKRRNMRLFLKGNRRRKSGDDSGEQGSNSSISSDDCRSAHTSYKENISSSRSARIDLTDFTKTLRDNNMLKGFTDNLRQNTFKHNFSAESSSFKSTQNFNNNLCSKQSNPILSQKHRFRNGFLLPSQRFNQSVASSVIPEKSEKNKNGCVMNSVKNYYAQNVNHNSTSGSEEEEIFTEMTVREKSKRSLDSEDESDLPTRKKSKISSPNRQQPKNNSLPLKPKNLNPSCNEFQFAKPTLPVRKSKPKVQEQLIAKSSQPLTDFLEPSAKIKEPISITQPSNIQAKSNDNISQLEQSETTQNSDVSLRPSFIKRKLFTQKLDVAEKANLSSDGTNSPLGNGHLFQNEKNKSRKLVTNQSCLNRDVEDDNNLLDLIHKIVPPDRMNITNQTTLNQTKTVISNKNKKDDADKWDVTSVISMCNDDDVSDTYTDEEIFEGDCKKDPKKNKDPNSKANAITTDKVVNNILLTQDCKIVLEKLQNNNIKQNRDNIPNSRTYNNPIQDKIKNSVKSFWDTDLESDTECQTGLPRCHIIDNLKKASVDLGTTKQDFKEPNGYARSQGSKKIPEVTKYLNNTSINGTVMNNTVDSMRKFNSSILSIRSHRTSKKNNCNQTCAKETLSNHDNEKSFIDKTNNKKTLEKNISNLNSADLPKANLITQNEKVAIKAPRSKKNSPKKKKPKTDKVESTKKMNTKKSEAKSNITCSSNNVKNKVTSKPETQINAFKNKVDNQTESTKVKNSKSNSKSDGQKNKKEPRNKSPKTKAKLETDRQNCGIRAKKNNIVSQTKSNLNNTVEPTQNTTLRSVRPMRSCRTPSQSRSIELSRSQLSNTSDATRSLRSRVINLSSSIENITIIKIKPRNKTINSKNLSYTNSRVSDVSFSLRSDRATPTPKKKIARNKADFFKGKRQT